MSFGSKFEAPELSSQHFQMEGRMAVGRLLSDGAFMATLELTDAHLIHGSYNSREALMFSLL